MNHSTYEHQGSHTAHCEHDEKSTGPPATQELMIEGAGCASCVGKFGMKVFQIDDHARATDRPTHIELQYYSSAWIDIKILVLHAWKPRIVYHYTRVIDATTRRVCTVSVL